MPAGAVITSSNPQLAQPAQKGGEGADDLATNILTNNYHDRDSDHDRDLDRDHHHYRDRDRDHHRDHDRSAALTHQIIIKCISLVRSLHRKAETNAHGSHRSASEDMSS
jgi:hypothetical protein